MSVESIQAPIFGLRLAFASTPAPANAIASMRVFDLLSGFAASDAAL